MRASSARAAVSEKPRRTGLGSAAYHRISAALFLAGFATFSLVYCVQPLLPRFAADFRVSAAASALPLSLTTGTLALAIVCAGALSQTLGRRRLMFVSIMAASLLNIAIALAPGWHALLAARALEGLLLGGVPAVAMAYLGEEIDPPGLSWTMGLYVGGTALGGMAGRVGVGILASLTSWRTAVAILGAVDVAAALCFLVLLPGSRNPAPGPGFDLRRQFRAFGAQLRHSGLPFLFLIGGAAMGAFVTVYNYTAFRLSAPPYDLEPAQIGLIFIVYLAGVAASFAAGGLADRIGQGRVLLAGLAVALAGVAMTLTRPLGSVIAGIVAVTIGFFVAHAVASGWVGRMAGSAKGHAASLYLLAYYAGASVMGSAGGWFWAQGGWPAVAAFSAALLLAAAAAAFHLWRMEQGGRR